MVIPQRKLTLITLALYWPALLVFAHMPVPESVRSANVSDKCLHFLAYIVLTFLVWFSIKPYEKVNWRKLHVWIILFGLTAYGAIDEVVQSFVGRSCDAMDLVTNIAGILFCLFLLTFSSFLPAALIVSGIVIFGIANLAKTNLAEKFPLAYGLFHVFAYSILTTFWIWNMNSLFKKKLGKLKWLITSIGVPLCYLIIVRIISFLLGRVINWEDIYTPIAGILIAAVIMYFQIPSFPKQTKTN